MTDILNNPLFEDMKNQKEVFWLNNKKVSMLKAQEKLSLSLEDIEDARNRLDRFSSYIKVVFPQTKKDNGIIESSLINISKLQEKLCNDKSLENAGSLYLKCDNNLPISGSIKARGGIYEVLKIAETIAFKNDLLTVTDDYSTLQNDNFKKLYSQYSIVVGSTGNLGLSIGIIGAKLGFNVSVHMSDDAKKWKKELLRSKGVKIVEYDDDYSKAVQEARKEAKKSNLCHFIDDENSKDLFLGYSVAALRLKEQLTEQKIIIDKEHPLFVYLPCGVGGAPGGISFGLKTIFQDNVHCFFAEPINAPCMLLGMATSLHDEICVQDINLDGKTCADGLAVGRASAFVGRFIEEFLSGIYTISDDKLYVLLALLKDLEDISIEPSASAGLLGMNKIIKSTYIKDNNLTLKLNNSTHIAWATGGAMLPKDEEEKSYAIGKKLLEFIEIND